MSIIKAKLILPSIFGFMLGQVKSIFGLSTVFLCKSQKFMMVLNLMEKEMVITGTKMT